MKQWSELDAVTQDPEKASGAWVFRGTQVLVAALFENLRDGATVEEFLDWFPGVERGEVEAVLDFELNSLRRARAQMAVSHLRKQAAVQGLDRLSAEEIEAQILLFRRNNEHEACSTHRSPTLA